MYIDPNSAGALYQFLFPVLIAIGSAFAFLRRTIVRACTKVAHAVASVFRRGERRDPVEQPRVEEARMEGARVEPVREAQQTRRQNGHVE
jgi:hypothetical protein